MPLEKYRQKETAELKKYRANFRDNYSYIEKYCKEEFKSGNYLDLFSKKTNLTELCVKEIKHIIELDYIKSNNYGFEVTPNTKNATDLLRKVILKQEIESTYKKSSERAVFELLQTIRDNITHQGKFEITDEQFNRNLILIKNASNISNYLIQLIDQENE